MIQSYFLLLIIIIIRIAATSTPYHVSHRIIADCHKRHTATPPYTTVAVAVITVAELTIKQLGSVLLQKLPGPFSFTASTRM